MRFFIFFILAAFLDAPAFAACADPDGVPGEIIYNDNIFQGCTKRGWMAFHFPLPPDCPDIGNICKNGTVYAGEFDGHKLYVAAADAPTKRAWGPEPGTSGMGFCISPFTASSCNEGLANTQLLKAHPSAFSAAEYCADLNAHGHDSGWFLPSRNELEVIYTNLKAGEPAGTHGFESGLYWASSEASSNSARARNFSNGSETTTSKQYASERVRCVRH